MAVWGDKKDSLCWASSLSACVLDLARTCLAHELIVMVLASAGLFQGGTYMGPATSMPHAWVLSNLLGKLQNAMFCAQEGRGGSPLCEPPPRNKPPAGSTYLRIGSRRISSLQINFMLCDAHNGGIWESSTSPQLHSTSKLQNCKNNAWITCQLQIRVMDGLL